MLVLITGQLRSGTSAVSQIVHALGVPVAVTIGAPIPPTFRPEWEDVELAVKLAPLMFGRPIRTFTPWFRAYLDDRRRAAEGMWGKPDFGCKSPLLTLVWDEVRELAAGARVITLTRKAASVEASARRAFRPDMIDAALACNRRIAAVLPAITPDLEVPYEGLVKDPGFWVERIVATVGVTDTARLHAAALTVKEPTTPC